jgi:membrane protease YdiL (CAAX protease family)
MKYQFNISVLELVPIACIVLATVSICSYWFLFVSTKFKAACIKRRPGDDGVILHIVLLKFAGLFMLGVVPYLIFMAIAPQYNWKSLGISFNSHTSLASIGWIIGLGIPMLLIVRHSAKKPSNYQQYPQIRVEAWDMPLMLRYSLAWTVYLLGYEMLFRGLLLFPLVDSFGIWFAIAINTGVCTASHLPKGPLETFAALVFGPLFCFITLQTETIWATWIIHAILAVANSMLAIKYHPTFYVVRNRRPVIDECEM